MGFWSKLFKSSANVPIKADRQSSAALVANSKTLVKGSSVSPTRVAPSAGVKREIHMAIARKVGAVKGDLDSMLITGIAQVETGEDGFRRQNITLNRGADFYTLLEVQSACYWDGKLTDGTIPRAQVVDWLLGLNEATNTLYLANLKPSEEPSEMAVMCGLTMASVHFAMRFNPSRIVPPIQQGERNDSVDPAQRVNDFNRSSFLNDAILSHRIPNEFVSHIAASVPNIESVKLSA